MFYRCFLFLLSPSLEVTVRNLIKHCHMFGSEPGLKRGVQNLTFPPQNLGLNRQLWAQNCVFSGGFTIMRLPLSSELWCLSGGKRRDYQNCSVLYWVDWNCETWNQRHKKCGGGNCGTNFCKQPKPHFTTTIEAFYVVLC